MALGAVAAGIVLLVLSADRFVTGAAATSKILGLPPLLIGMRVIGFGSSMPEMVISGFSAAGGNPGLALGNAMGSNIANIALILGATALVSPIAVRSRVIKLELPLLGLLSRCLQASFCWTASCPGLTATFCWLRSPSRWGGPSGSAWVASRTPLAMSSTRNSPKIASRLAEP